MHVSNLFHIGTHAVNFQIAFLQSFLCRWSVLYFYFLCKLFMVLPKLKNKTDWTMCINKSLAVFSLMVHLAKLVVTFWWLFLGHFDGNIWDRCRICIMVCVVILYYNTLVLLSLKNLSNFLYNRKKVPFLFSLLIFDDTRAFCSSVNV